MDQLGNQKHVIVVDDDVAIHDLLTAYFRPKQYKISCFANAEPALEECLKSGQNWDLILTDFHFPSMSGVEFTEKVKQILPQIPVILITPLDQVDVVAQTIARGTYDFIHKPIHFAQLQVAVERAFELHSLKVDLEELRLNAQSATSSKVGIIGRSPAFLAALDLARRVASSSANIFITGESGTGKEVFAKYIHSQSQRSKQPFVAINCTAIPENLLESELFGHAKGSFTGAQDKRIGLFEEAEDGTLFLDEIGDLSFSLQAKLLRVLQERKIKRVGENTQRAINCRIISATHKDLTLEVKTGHFREDLYYRLNVIPIAIPSLRERPEDLLPLAETFLRKFSLQNGSRVKSLSKDAIRFLVQNQWRGNVRELENTIERAVVICANSEVVVEDFMPRSPTLDKPSHEETYLTDGNTFSVQCADHLPTLDEVIQKYIEFAVVKKGGARDKTAKEIGIDRKTLYKRMRTAPDVIQ